MPWMPGPLPAMTMAENADEWQLRATSSTPFRLSLPVRVTAITAACIPAEQPLTRNHVCSAPKASAASRWASRMGPVGDVR